MSIIGVGIDVAEIERFAASLERTPGLARRLFVESELLLPSGERRGIASLAARFAAKEALAKALGAPAGLYWTDAEVWCEDSGQPRLRVKGTVAARAEELGVRSWHVSLSHDAGVASAVVIAEGEPSRPAKSFFEGSACNPEVGVQAGSRYRSGGTNEGGLYCDVDNGADGPGAERDRAAGGRESRPGRAAGRA